MGARQPVIRTIQRGDKLGALMIRSEYDEVKNYFLQVLEEENPTSIINLLAKGHEKFSHVFKEETGWYLYNVKLDLEARGMISHIYSDKKSKRTLISKSIGSVNTPERPPSTAPGIITKELTKSVRTRFHELFGKLPYIINAPGRINLLGEHTDYNGGYVMPAAIDKGILFAVNTASKETTIYSSRFKQFLSVDLENIQPLKNSEWQNYLLGILYQLKSKGYKIKNFSCVFDGDLPLGAGLSSSAAMQCGFVLSLSTLFDLKISREEMIRMAQWSEHHFVGVKCGIMDQFASLMSRENHVIQLDCQNLEFRYYPLELNNYCLLLCDTNVKHSLASSEYNLRRAQCEEGIKIIQRIYEEVRTLRDVMPEMLASCQKIMPTDVFRRCKYVVQENLRVVAAAKDLVRGDMVGFGNKMYETHEGLKTLYEVSCPELDFLVEFSKSMNGIVGSRMMGAGFGGCTINIIENHLVGSFIEKIRPLYKQKFGFDMSYYVVKTANGASVIESPVVTY
jgi:galactokinase